MSREMCGFAESWNVELGAPSESDGSQAGSMHYLSSEFLS